MVSGLEWGPRALGNRSIVCDPRRADMKDILNLKIKRRGLLGLCTIILRVGLDWFEQGRRSIYDEGLSDS